VLTDDERTRIGRTLQRLREDQDWDQRDIASKAEISVGTVQAIEYNKYKVLRDNIDKYAAVFGTTTHKLLHPEPFTITSSDALLADLNREHLTIARGYMRAVKVVRAAVEILVAPSADHFTEEIAEIVLTLKRASEGLRDPQMAYWMTIVLGRPDLLQDLAQRLDTDPGFEDTLLTLLNKTNLKEKK
jgi:transcriptional regulator with XRE-family HTH domain